MIIDPKPNEPLFPIVSENPRPCIFEEKDRIYWKEAHKFIKESTIEIMVNKVFWGIDEGLKDPEFQYAGGHFKYNFLFKTKEDKETFFKQWNEKLNKLKENNYGLV